MADQIVTFDDIKKIFKPYRGQMLRHSVATPDGVFSLDLTDYNSVKRLNDRITIAIHGYEQGRESTYPMPPPDDDGTPNPLADEDIKTWDDWVAGGMIESPTPLA